MEQEKLDEQENLRQAGRTAADALRGYGYDEVAQQYEQVLHRFDPSSKEVLAHSRIASTTLKELNQLTEERLGKNPALERTVEVQQRLEQALQPEPKPKALEELSFPARQYLETNSKPLEQASEEVSRYLEEKSRYSDQREDDTKLRTNLNQQLDSYRALPTAYNLERLEKYTRHGIEVMRSDYEQAKAIQQEENEEYVANAKSLSPHGRAEILAEAEQGEFRMPNQQKGQHVALRADRAEQQLQQYTQVRAKITSIDQDYQEVVQRSLVSPGQEIRGEEVGPEKTASPLTNLSVEQQERYAELMVQPSVPAPSRQAEVEL
ncbi:hypothetical protein [Tunicatimonas pelagia]|uniref:hypothetical protein n=1 Tax=Tunicatimonas pelagia TaxID=931531 RepID=UPI0026657F06|nr:hypothetical protein [Tunicatimonas pelagia]WKN44249.1 hypothetical protein P0M28_04635 [Tunicatimonas pelagia]